MGDANRSGNGDIARSFGYNLPHRGTTGNYGTSSGDSMLDDGDTATYWKSDPYLDEAYTGESNMLHPGWIIVDLGSRMGVTFAAAIAFIPASEQNIRWSAEAAPSSAANSAPPVQLSSSAWIRG